MASLVIDRKNRERVAAAMKSLPRERFVEMNDSHLVIGRSIPPLGAVAKILHHADIRPDHKVLEVGTGAGYLTALLSKLGGEVVTLEKNPAIARNAQNKFNQLGLNNLILRVGDGGSGAADLGPFDRILVASPSIREKSALLEQLADGGRLLALEEGEYNTLLLAQYELTELGAVVRRELALVDFSKDSGMSLLDIGMVDQQTLARAKLTARQQRLPVIKVLREMLNLEDLTLYRRLAAENGMTFATVDELLPTVEPELMESFSRSFLDSTHIIPLHVEDGTLIIATDDPDCSVEDIYHMYAFDRVRQILVTPQDFARLWTTIELSIQGHGKLFREQEPEESRDLLEHGEAHIQAHLITLLDAMLLDAVSEGASDLHIEPYENRTRIRLRVDGDLHDLQHYKISEQDTRGLVNVIKIRGDMDIAEKRLPQGGRSQLQVGGVGYDLRIQVQPSLHGEAVVIRLLPKSGEVVQVSDLGMAPTVAAHYQRMLDNPSGMVLVVGPTGCGKTTTLNAGLSLLAEQGHRKVITIEDPIEYSIANIQQTSTHPEIGFSFADGMRSFVRQDPDVILVGEIRDQETAMEAVRASQTGHVVLSTLHSNDAVDAIQRLYDLQVHPNSLASELAAVIAQRLARRICPDCRTEAEPDPHILEELFPTGTPVDFRCFVGKGCEACSHRGTQGRIAVVEYMQVNDDIRSAMSQQLPIAQLRAIALDCGLVTMRDAALEHLRNGTIALTEIPRILSVERMAPEKRGGWA